MWSSILKSTLALATKVLDTVMVRTLMKYVNSIEKLEKQLAEEKAKPLNLQDDVYMEYLEASLEVELRAFDRQLLVGVKAAGVG